MLTEKPSARALMRILVAVMPLTFIFFIVTKIPKAWIYPLWFSILICTALFYAACYLIPQQMYHWQSMPYTFQVRNNLGDAGLHRQLLTYAAYHTNWYNHITHAVFPIEAFFWMVNIAYWGKSYGIILVVSLLVWQASLFSEKFFLMFLVAFWLVLAMLALIWVNHAPALANYVSMVALISCGFWRFTGHWFEAIPPGLLGNRNFIAAGSIQWDKRLIPGTMLGFVSEFAAGLPFRLVIPWIYVGLQTRFPSAKLVMRWSNAKNTRIDLHSGGWQLHPVTRDLVANSIKD